MALVYQALAAIESEAEAENQEVKPKDFSIYYYHCDQIGAPQELTNEQGDIVWAVDYKVWGRTTALQVSATGTDDADPHDLNRFWPGGPRDLKALQRQQRRTLNEVEQNLRFQGQYFDAESGLHFNGFRYYDPAIGRFIHQDPIGLFGGPNLYRYGPNPTGWTDVLGLASNQQLGTYGSLTGRANKGDQLEAHEFIRHEALEAMGCANAKKRNKKNPAIALDLDTHDDVHRIENKLARQHLGNGVNQFDFNTQGQPSKRQMDIWAGALRKAGVPASRVKRLRRDARKFLKCNTCC